MFVKLGAPPGGLCKAPRDSVLCWKQFKYRPIWPYDTEARSQKSGRELRISLGGVPRIIKTPVVAFAAGDRGGGSVGTRYMPFMLHVAPGGDQGVAICPPSPPGEQLPSVQSQ